MPYCSLSAQDGFGFIPGGAPCTPEERGRLRKERLGFFSRCRAYQSKTLAKFKLGGAPTNSCDSQYTREYVRQNADIHHIIPIPAPLVSPATQILDPDMFIVVPKIPEHAPPKWDEWHPTRHSEDNNEAIDVSKLWVPATSSSGDFYPDDLARYFPFMWRKALAEHTCEVRRTKKKRPSKVRSADGRHRL
ncbi:hypothetical protein BC826DRAFT_1106469 [Russula brevipes]|nr:hypothetical protein BC826DRAFT_1106469 [Russula brevipes]